MKNITTKSIFNTERKNCIMINLPAILIANGTAVFLLLLLMFSYGRTLHHSELDGRFYFCMMVFSLFQSLLETGTFLVDGQPGTGLRGLSVAINTLLFINNILFALTWTLYADYKLFSDKTRLRRIYPFVAIPAALVVIGSIANLFTPVFFTVSADNIYARSGLYMVPFALTYLYLAYGVLLIYAFRKKVNKYLFLPAIVFILPILLGSIIQFFFYGYSLIWLGTAIGLTSLYINVQNENTYVEPLSGLFTRQYMNQYLEGLFRRPEVKEISGIMLDIDNFKAINDNYGHLTGDNAIAAFGRILRQSVPPDDLAVRFAGDEFILIHPQGGVKELQGILARIADNTRRFNETEGASYRIEYSCGLSGYRDGDTVDTFLGRLDREMYIEKNRRKNFTVNVSGNTFSN